MRRRAVFGPSAWLRCVVVGFCLVAFFLAYWSPLFALAVLVVGALLGVVDLGHVARDGLLAWRRRDAELLRRLRR